MEESKVDWLLVIAGRKDKRFLNLETAIKEAGIESSVILTDFISQEEKVALYKRAVALTFPSYYEGFGLPVLEAQSLGVPVLNSNVSSLPEVGGSGALYVDPRSPEDIAAGMKKMAYDRALREKLIAAGYENVKRFSWDKAAEKLISIFKTAGQ